MGKEIQPLDTHAGYGRLIWRGFFIILAACGVFVLNNLGIVSAHLHPAPGTVPMSGYRGSDLALYETWMRLFQHSLFIPNFTVPETTEPGFFNLLMFLIGRLSGLLELPPPAVSLGVQAALYIVATFGIYYALHVFLESTAQRWLAVALLICSVPVPSLAVLPKLLRGSSWPLSGIGYFVWFTSDGLYHGIEGSILVTFGTAATVIAFSLIGAYLKSGKTRLLAAACGVTFLVGAVHANEAVLISVAALAALTLRSPQNRLRAMLDGLTIGGCGAVGVLLLVVPALLHPWVRQIGQNSADTPVSPVDMITCIGLPALLCLGLLRRWKALTTNTDALLLFWFLLSIVGAMTPVLPTPQHFLDGFHYVTPILLVRLLTQKPAIEFIYSRRKLAVAGLAIACVLSLGAYLRYCWQGYLDGCTLTPRRLFAAVQPREEAEVIAWLRANADLNAIAMAPITHSAWLGTVPIRSIRGHWLWSMNSPARKRARDFYAGKMNCSEASEFLSYNQVRYVVVDRKFAAEQCVPDADMRADFGPLLLYDYRGARRN
jgi:hypothetical protein